MRDWLKLHRTTLILGVISSLIAAAIWSAVVSDRRSPLPENSRPASDDRTGTLPKKEERPIVKTEDEAARERKQLADQAIEQESRRLAAEAPAQGRAYPIAKDFAAWWYTVRLHNAEIGERSSLRLNFEASFLPDCAPCPPEMLLWLESPKDTAFVTDQLGRQHNLVEAVGISGTEPLKVPLKSSRRFSLVFPLTPGLEAFNYRVVLLMRVKIGEDAHPREVPLAIRSNKEIRIAEFR